MFFLAFCRKIVNAVMKPYRPELHYMRGPGPKWFARHGRPSGEVTRRLFWRGVRGKGGYPKLMMRRSEAAN